MRVFVPMVYERVGHAMAPSLRTIQLSLSRAKAHLDEEIERAGKQPLEWRDEFGGAIAARDGLTYEIVPADARL